MKPRYFLVPSDTWPSDGLDCCDCVDSCVDEDPLVAVCLESLVEVVPHAARDAMVMETIAANNAFFMFPSLVHAGCVL